VVRGTDIVLGWNTTMWVSGGPFEFESWTQPTADDPFATITLTANENYWKTDPDSGQQLPLLDRVVYRFVGDVETLVTEFKERRLDVINPGTDPVVLEELAALDGATLDVVGGGQWEHLSFQFGEGRLSRNPGSYNEHIEFRRAVAYALDRDFITSTVFGDAWTVGMDSYIEAFTPAWAGEGWARYEFDQDRAREELAALCAKEEVDCATAPPSLVFVTTSADIRMAVAAVIEPLLEQVGIQVEVVLDPPLVFFGNTLDFGRYDLGGYSWKGSPGLASLVAIHGAWDPQAVPPIGLAFSRWGARAVSGQTPDGYNQGPSSVIDDNTRRYEIIATEMRFTADARELQEYFAEAEEILADQVVFIPLFEIPDAGVYWSDEFTGYKHNTTWAGDLWNVATWYRTDG
jgi:ABC-type transport system substrate-binding protein